MAKTTKRDRAATAAMTRDLARAASEARSAAYWESACGEEYARTEWAIVVSWLFAALADRDSPRYVQP